MYNKNLSSTRATSNQYQNRLFSEVNLALVLTIEKSYVGPNFKQGNHIHHSGAYDQRL